MYAMKTKRKNKKICKAIKNYIINNKITFEDYENCLFNKQIISFEQNVIRSMACTPFNFMMMSFQPSDSSFVIFI